MLRVVGAGLGRTGTNSLKLALERLLGAPCYHMYEVFQHLDHVPTWTAALRNQPVDWRAFLDGYAATVDWPAATFWRELVAANPDALVVLSRRRDAEAWWRSADNTIFRGMRDGTPEPHLAEWREMVTLMMQRFTPDWQQPGPAKAAYERHNAEVVATLPPDRLLVWHPDEGWPPLCEALGVPVPEEPFPHVNSSADWDADRERAGDA